MLIFTHSLKSHIKKNVLPILLMNSDKYIIKGSFKDKIPYVTNIIVENFVFPEIDKTNIYDNLFELIIRIKKHKKIILANIICGIDERFEIKSGTDDEFERIKKFIDQKDIDNFEALLQMYHHDKNKKIFYANKLLKKYQEMYWQPELGFHRVLDGIVKINENNAQKNFIDVLHNNSIVILQYYINIGSYPLNITLIINYGTLKNADHRKHCLMSQNLDKVNRDIEKKFGLHRQIMARIESYSVLYYTGNLDIGMATTIIVGLIKDLHKIPDFDCGIIEKIKKVAINNPPDIKMSSWNTILAVLYENIDTYLNITIKKYSGQKID